MNTNDGSLSQDPPKKTAKNREKQNVVYSVNPVRQVGYTVNLIKSNFTKYGSEPKDQFSPFKDTNSTEIKESTQKSVLCF